jgi:peroxiredoxin
MKARIILASFLTVLAAAAGVRAGSTARQDRIVRPGSDAPLILAYSVTPKTLKDNRINFVRLYFKFHDDLMDLKGGLLTVNFIYKSSSGAPLYVFPPRIPEPSDQPAAPASLVVVPDGRSPQFFVYPLIEDVFKQREGKFELWFGLLAEDFGKVTVDFWLRDSDGTIGVDEPRVDLVRSTKSSGPKQGFKIGQLAYDFTLLDQANNRRTLSKYRGKVVLIDISTMWCSYCKLEAADLQQLYLKYRKQGFIVLNMLGQNYATNPIRPSDCKTWAQAYKITFPVLADLFFGVCQPYQGFSSTLRFPSNFLIDRKGKIRWKKVGYNATIKAQLEAKIQQLLAE